MTTKTKTKIEEEEPPALSLAEASREARQEAKLATQAENERRLVAVELALPGILAAAIEHRRNGVPRHRLPDNGGERPIPPAIQLALNEVTQEVADLERCLAALPAELSEAVLASDSVAILSVRQREKKLGARLTAARIVLARRRIEALAAEQQSYVPILQPLRARADHVGLAASLIDDELQRVRGTVASLAAAQQSLTMRIRQERGRLDRLLHQAGT